MDQYSIHLFLFVGEQDFTNTKPKNVNVSIFFYMNTTWEISTLPSELSESTAQEVRGANRQFGKCRKT